MPQTVRFFALAVLILLAQSLRASPPIGAEVQNWHYDPLAKALTVRVENTSQKDITAFNLSVTEKYADGTSNFSERTTDYLPLMASVSQFEELRQQHGNGTFAAGTSRDVTIPEPKDVADVSIIPDVVVYADLTADVTNERAFNHIVDGRKEVALATQQANQALKDALAAPDPKGAAVKELTRLADVAKGSGNGLAEITLRGVAQNVKRADDLAPLIKDGEARTALYASHSQLVRGGQQ
jgi:hypothetical protein